MEIDGLAAHMTALRHQGMNLVVIDTPLALLDTIRTASAVADLVFIPARPSPHDLQAVGVVVERAEQARKALCFVVNGATPRSLIALEAVQALAQHGPVAPVILHRRIDFAASMTDGRTADELNPRPRSAEEIAQSWKYVHTQLRKYRKGT